MGKAAAKCSFVLVKLIHFTDWISYYAGLLNNIDPTPVIRIQTLKHKISQ